MSVRAVFFDVGETLVDEERIWREVALDVGLRPHVLLAALGTTIERGEEHWRLWERLGLQRPDGLWDRIGYRPEDVFPDVSECLERLRARGLSIGVAGNQSDAMEAWARSTFAADIVTSSVGLGVTKPDPVFFERLAALAGVSPREAAYVGDRVDNDVLPALRAGLAAVHLRRGPWGLLQTAPPGVPTIDSLADLPDVLAGLP